MSCRREAAVDGPAETTATNVIRSGLRGFLQSSFTRFNNWTRYIIQKLPESLASASLPHHSICEQKQTVQESPEYFRKSPVKNHAMSAARLHIVLDDGNDSDGHNRKRKAKVDATNKSISGQKKLKTADALIPGDAGDREQESPPGLALFADDLLDKDAGLFIKPGNKALLWKLDDNARCIRFRTESSLQPTIGTAGALNTTHQSSSLNARTAQPALKPLSSVDYTEPSLFAYNGVWPVQPVRRQKFSCSYESEFILERSTKMSASKKQEGAPEVAAVCSPTAPVITTASKAALPLPVSSVMRIRDECDDVVFLDGGFRMPLVPAYSPSKRGPTPRLIDANITARVQFPQRTIKHPNTAEKASCTRVIDQKADKAVEMTKDAVRAGHGTIVFNEFDGRMGTEADGGDNNSLLHATNSSSLDLPPSKLWDKWFIVQPDAVEPKTITKAAGAAVPNMIYADVSKQKSDEKNIDADYAENDVLPSPVSLASPTSSLIVAASDAVIDTAPLADIATFPEKIEAVEMPEPPPAAAAPDPDDDDDASDEDFDAELFNNLLMKISKGVCAVVARQNDEAAAARKERSDSSTLADSGSSVQK